MANQDNLFKVVNQGILRSGDYICFIDDKKNVYQGFAFLNGANLRVAAAWPERKGNRKAATIQLKAKTTIAGDFVAFVPNAPSLNDIGCKQKNVTKALECMATNPKLYVATEDLATIKEELLIAKKKQIQIANINDLLVQLPMTDLEQIERELEAKLNLHESIADVTIDTEVEYENESPLQGNFLQE